MNIHLTCINGLGGAAGLSQHKVREIGKIHHYNDMGIYHYKDFVDSNSELNCRIDGIIASLSFNDIVIFQYPTWNSERFNNNLMAHFEAYHTRIIIFVHDINSLMWNHYVQKDSINQEIAFLNRASVLILPSVKMHHRLIELGLSVKHVVYQEIWDYPIGTVYNRHQPLKKFHFPGDPNRFPFITSYQGTTPIDVYCAAELPEGSSSRIKRAGFLSPDDLIYELSIGGIGLVWSDPDYFEQYYSLNQSYKLASFLAAGLPVVVQEGTAYAEFIKKNHIGYVCKTLEEADSTIQKLNDSQFQTLYQNVQNIQFLVTRGYYTEMVLEKAIGLVQSAACQEI